LELEKKAPKIIKRIAKQDRNKRKKEKKLINESLKSLDVWLFAKAKEFKERNDLNNSDES
jgi:hypothetical protein